MIVRHLHTVYALRSVLDQPTAAMQTLRTRLTIEGHYPRRRTWARRRKALPASLPAQIGCLGRYLVALIQPWTDCGRAAAIDSPVLRARGGVWHKQDRETGEVPHTSIAPEAHWTKSGWHGGVYGWNLVAAVWIPLAADLTAAKVAESESAPSLVGRLPAEVRYVLGDRHYTTPEVREQCDEDGRILVTSRYGRYRHTDDGVEVRRIFHKLRSLANEHLNEQFKGIFDAHGPVPTRGRINTRRFALGAIIGYQLTLWYRFEHELDLRVGLKPFLKAA